MPDTVTPRLASQLAALRAERGLTLDELAALSGVSRAALSRMEKAEVSPTAEVLARLCAAYGFSLSRLMAMLEEGFSPVIRRDDQTVARDKDSGFLRRVLSPANPALAAEIVECRIDPGQRIAQESPPVPGREHHLALLSGRLSVELNGMRHDLTTGDVLRFRHEGPAVFETPKNKGAKYMLVRVAT